MLKKLLITGANGGLGSVFRHRLTPLAQTLRLSDCDDLGVAADHEEIVTCDLGDKAAVQTLVEGCDGIVHLGGISREAPWDAICNANIDGVFNLYEGVRKSSAKPRIIFASSNHAIGFSKRTERLNANAPTRPDSLYGVSKVFGEAIARLYFDKFGIETATVRIGSCFPEPANHRMLSTWLSYEDFFRLIERVFQVPHLGCPVIYGSSANSAAWWDNASVSYLGWQPVDNAEEYRAKLGKEPAPNGDNDPALIYQGGDFCAEPIHETPEPKRAPK